jgi:hypothetical protein
MIRAAAMLALVACTGEEPALARLDHQPRIEPPPARAPEPLDVPSESHPFLGESRDQEAIALALAEGTIEALRPTGTSDLVFEARLSNGERARFVPNTRRSPRSARAEVAAYRIARLAGFDTLPPAVHVRVPLAEIEERLHPDYRDAWRAIERELVIDGDAVEGALVHQPFPIRDLGRRPVREATARLSARDEPEGGFTLFDRDVANLLMFDYLIGNPERLDQAGPYARPSGDRLYFLDQRDAFAPETDADAARRVIARLEPLRRASLSFARALDRMDRASIAAIAGGDHLLDEAELRALADRRDALVSLLRARADLHGESAVLVFD